MSYSAIAGTSAQGPTPEKFDFGPFRVDIPKYRLARDGEPVGIGPKAFEILVVLIKHHERVVEKDELLRAVWPNVFVSEDNLTQNIWALRRALGDDSSHPQFIVTVPRRGYRFIADLQTVVEETGDREAIPAAATSQEDVSEPAIYSAKAHNAAMDRVFRPAYWVLLFLAAGGFGLGWLAGRETGAVASGASRSTLVRFVQAPPNADESLSTAAVSPDGLSVAFATIHRASGQQRLWIRSLSSAEARPLPGTDGASVPFWSPDSLFIAFFADNKVRRVSMGRDESPQTIASVPPWPVSGTWSTDGTLLLEDRYRGFLSVSRTGVVSSVLRRTAAELELKWPQFLPDGRRFLFYMLSSDPNLTGTYVASLDSKERTRILDGSALDVTFAAPSQLVYIRNRVLTAQSFDLNQLKPTGVPTPIAGDVSVTSATMARAISTGDRVLTLLDDVVGSRLAIFDRAGKELSTIAATRYRNPQFSKDERQVLADSTEGALSSLWLFNLERGTSVKLVPGGQQGVWSPNGKEIAYALRRDGVENVYSTSVSGDHSDKLILESKQGESTAGRVTDWSRDGQYMIVLKATPQKMGVWLLPLMGSPQLKPLLQTTSNEMQGRISPDGRWIAYSSEESGIWRVYVQTFPVSGWKETVSVGGAAQPRWRGDGKELFFLSVDHWMMAVDVQPQGNILKLGVPRRLFRTRIAEDVASTRNHYDVSADGQRFVIDSTAEDHKSQHLNVFLNW